MSNTTAQETTNQGRLVGKSTITFDHKEPRGVPGSKANKAIAGAYDACGTFCQHTNFLSENGLPYDTAVERANHIAGTAVERGLEPVLGAWLDGFHIGFQVSLDRTLERLSVVFKQAIAKFATLQNDPTLDQQTVETVSKVFLSLADPTNYTDQQTNQQQEADLRETKTWLGQNPRGETKPRDIRGTEPWQNRQDR